MSPLGGVWSRGVVPGGGGVVQGGCVVQGEWSRGCVVQGVSAQGVCLFMGGCLFSGGGGGIPACTKADAPAPL